MIKPGQLLFRFLLTAAFLVIVAYITVTARPQNTEEAPEPTLSPVIQRAIPAAATEQAHVTEVIDGDTVKVRLGDQLATVRLIGINTPETVDPRKPVQCFGEEASQALKQQLENTDIFMASDPDQQNLDRYGRLLRYIYKPDGVFMNEWLIRQGFAYEYTYDRPYQFQQQFKQAQAEARQASVGLWAACPVSSPDIDED